MGTDADWQSQGVPTMLVRQIPPQGAIPACRQPAGPFGGLRLGSKRSPTFWLDRPDPNDRFFIYDQRLSLGLQMDILPNGRASASGGYGLRSQHVRGYVVRFQQFQPPGLGQRTVRRVESRGRGFELQEIHYRIALPVARRSLLEMNGYHLRRELTAMGCVPHRLGRNRAAVDSWPPNWLPASGWVRIRAPTASSFVSSEDNRTVDTGQFRSVASSS